MYVPLSPRSTSSPIARSSKETAGRKPSRALPVPTFEDLPIKIIFAIVDFYAPFNPEGGRIRKDGLCNLRLVSSRLNETISPVLFRELRLNFDDANTHESTAPDSLRCQEIIHALADDSTRAFRSTRQLSLSTQKLFWTENDRRPEVAEQKQLVIERIFDAVSALKDLRTVIYYSNSEREPEELAINFIGALSTLPVFEGFTNLLFLGNPPPSFTLQPLRNLKTFKVSWNCNRPYYLVPEIASLLTRCPDLSELRLDGELSAAGKDTTFAEVFAEVAKMEEGKVLRLRELELCGVLVTPDDIKANIRHFKNLASLKMAGNPSPDARTTVGSICTIFQENDIFLKSISTDIAHDPLLLSSLSLYSGLTELELDVQDPSEDSSQTMEKVYTQVLPKHRETLEILRLGHSFRRLVWYDLPTEMQFAELVKCQKLWSLRVHLAIKAGDDLTPLERWLEVGLQLPDLTFLDVVAMGDGPDLAADELVRKFRKERGMKFGVICF